MRNEELMNKWKPILEHTALPGIQKLTERQLLLLC